VTLGMRMRRVACPVMARTYAQVPPGRPAVAKSHARIPRPESAGIATRRPAPQGQGRGADAEASQLAVDPSVALNRRRLERPASFESMRLAGRGAGLPAPSGGRVPVAG
jgi:hypothetical protein